MMASENKAREIESWKWFWDALSSASEACERAVAIVRIQSVSFLRKGVGPLFFSFTLICPGEIRKFLHFRGSTTCYVNWRQVKVYMMRGQGIFFIKSQLNQK